MYAARQGHTDTVTVLLQLGTDINMRNVSYILSIICYNYYYVVVLWIHSSHVSCYIWLQRNGNYPTTTRS